MRAGLRVSEVVALQDEDISISERKGQVVIRQGKGLKERTIPLNRQARQALQKYLDSRPPQPNPHLFVTRSGKQLTNRDMQRLVAQAGQRAGLSHQVTPHVLRHSFATRALRQGKLDLATLSHILGHANLATTARYLHPNQNEMAEMVEGL